MRSSDYWKRYENSVTVVIKEVPEEDHVFQHEGRNLKLYHFNGLSALRAIVLGLIAYDIPEPHAIMDFGCAYGRVMRYIRAAFPLSELTACDLRADAIAYCAKTLNAIPILSSSNFSDLHFESKHDLIWLGSVFTHFDSDSCITLLNKMIENLNEGGLLIFSLHGRVYPQEVQPNRWKILEDDAFSIANTQYEASGFGYHDYPGRPGVGASLTTPSWVFEIIRKRSDVVFSYQERLWTGWHDVAYIHKISKARDMYSIHGDAPY